MGDGVYTAAKRFFTGTHRTATPEETLARITPHLARCGITRLADVTGLDRVGIHTVLGHRPNSSTLAGSAGKGFSLVAATVSAAMEGIECYHAETMRLPHVEAAWNDLPEDGRIPLDRMPGSKDSAFQPDRPEYWTWGWDLIGGRRIAAPWTAVGLHSVPGARPGPRSFYAAGTNGLASGNHILEAVVSGLCEVMERDAVSCWGSACDQLQIPTPRVDLTSIDHPTVRDLLNRFEAAGVRPLLFDVTNDLGLPSYMAMVYDRDVRNMGMSRGYGSHLEPAVAMCRALTEAVQARLVMIAGSRDDFFRRDMIRNQNADGSAGIAALEAQPATVDGRRHADLSTPTFEGDITVLLGLLQRVGLSQVLVFDLTQPEMGIPVVRVLVPGLEGYRFDFYAAGSRAHGFTEMVRTRMAAGAGVA
ncbi:YcaO-like family protein [Azospirillum sp. B510]|uniref:YcaO-like family protein n=1 Tax=Azospirillum sp. (strain B510) TaxID=137722 RepID=UPI001FFF3EBC|nr:YcaO-like family protein [Azospirillum sp. B510]